MEYPDLVLVTGSTVVHVGPCLVYGVTLAGDGAAADCQIYDGVNDNAEQKGHLEALSGTTFELSLGNPTPFHYGIYIVTTATYGKVMIEFKPTKKCET